MIIDSVCVRYKSLSPILVHAAQWHRGLEPKFMAQPPLLLRSDFSIEGSGPFSPVEEAIRIALSF